MHVCMYVTLIGKNASVEKHKIRIENLIFPNTHHGREASGVLGNLLRSLTDSEQFTRECLK